jgi:CubicO group peptidase (beta-lactamase class C family)
MGDAMNRTRRLTRAAAILLCVAGASASTAEWQINPATAGGSIPEAKDRNPVELGLGAYAKTLCSAIFVSQRDPARATEHARILAVTSMGLPEADGERASVDIDRMHRLVRIALPGSFSRTARYYGDQGCILDASPERPLHFTPVPVITRLPDAMSQPWPMGDAASATPPPADVDLPRVQRAVDLAFAPDALTTAFLVVYKGQVIGERYAPGITKDTQLESWSMGKSLTATLLGRLLQDGHFTIDDPAPVPAWRREGDPRGGIRISHLLRMSSGLQCTREDATGYTDHFYFYTGAIDAFAYATSRPLAFPPNTVGRYRNCDPLTLGDIIKRTVTSRGEEYLTYPQRGLFDEIGIRKQVLETDPYGNFLLTGHDYGTARNWARIGMLYLNEGVWNGKRLLPQSFVEFVRTPAPAWQNPVYAGQFWVNGTGAWNLPRDAFFASGNGGQNTFIVPSHDLVIVRLGDHPGARASRAAVRAAQAEILAAIAGPSPSRPSARRDGGRHVR